MTRSPAAYRVRRWTTRFKENSYVWRNDPAELLHMVANDRSYRRQPTGRSDGDPTDFVTVA